MWCGVTSRDSSLEKYRRMNVSASRTSSLARRVQPSPAAVPGQRRCSPGLQVSIATVPRSCVSTIVPERRQLPLPPPEPPPAPDVVVAAIIAPCDSGISPCKDCCCAAVFVLAVNAFAGVPALLARPPTQASASAESSQYG